MKIYFDIESGVVTNSRGVPVAGPLSFVAGTTPRLRIYFLRNGEVVVPSLRSLSVALGHIGVSAVASASTYLVERDGAHVVHLNLTGSGITAALTSASWDAITSDGTNRAYTIGAEEDAPALFRAKGFRVLVDDSPNPEYVIPPGLYAIDVISRTLTLDSSVVPPEDAAVTVEAMVPEAWFTLLISVAELISKTITGVTTNTLTTVTGSDTTGLFVGSTITGTGIQNGTTVATIGSASAFTLSAAATATGSRTLTVQSTETITAVTPARVHPAIS